jgi:hypothetical protein
MYLLKVMFLINERELLLFFLLIILNYSSYETYHIIHKAIFS